MVGGESEKLDETAWSLRTELQDCGLGCIPSKKKGTTVQSEGSPMYCCM